MRASIIIHSISGNLYLIASEFASAMEALGIDARLYRVTDPDLHIEANHRTEVIEYYEEIMELPEVKVEKLEKADCIIIGSPSRFGMPTAEMKAFIDTTLPLYKESRLAGKFFYAFTSSAVSEEDGLRTAGCLYTWSRMMGMENIPFEPYVHIEGELMPNRPSEGIDRTANHLAATILAVT